jgi:anaerobic selenocysteine-containing dehydrogenase
MDVSRRDVLKGAGQLAALAAAGADLAPTVAQAQELRIEHAKAVPSVCP